jgi:hypothetical protein
MNQKLPCKLSREDVAQLEVGQTQVSRGLAGFLTVFFLMAIFLVPLIQLGCGHSELLVRWREGWRGLPVSQVWDIVRIARGGVRTWRTSDLSLYERILSVNRILLKEMEQFEIRLQEGSWLTQLVLPPVQYALSQCFGIGNEKTYLGQGEWLFYRPGIEYLTGQGFLPARSFRGGAGLGEEIPPSRSSDPITAIVRFRDQLAARGIQLVILPVPGKASVHPDRFSPVLDAGVGVLQNPDYERFEQELTARGVHVVPADRMLAEWTGRSGQPAYLATDTHWTPDAMRHVAEGVALTIRPLLSTPRIEPIHSSSQAQVENLGDLGVMLKQPDSRGWPRREYVTIYPVNEIVSGAKWKADPAAEVLLLGDSYCNIYSLESMRWGTGAGFAEHLSLALELPVDTILRNDNGAYATRELLVRDLARGTDRLAGKKVLIWEFAQRELAQGDWKQLDLVLAPPRLMGERGLQELTGAHTRVVWMEAVDPSSTDVLGDGAGFRLMGLDTEDGRGVREIVSGPISCRKPLITPDGRHVVFTDAPRGKTMIVNWDGSDLRELAEGYAAGANLDPGRGSQWIYGIRGPLNPSNGAGSPMVRYELNRPWNQEIVWDLTEVNLDNFQISQDGSMAAGLFPWPHAGIVDLKSKTLTRIGRGCWTSFAPDNSYIAWFFDGAHRNLMMANAITGSTWAVPISHAPGTLGYEVYHPRWSNHTRFFGMTGPYKAGGGNDRIGAGGKEVEIYVGRFSADLHRVERWARVTMNTAPELFPDVWIDPLTEPAFDVSDVDPAHVTEDAVARGPAVVEARLKGITPVPTIESIAPYRQALVVYEYEVLRVHSGDDPGPRITVHHWAIRDERSVAPRWTVGETVLLVLEPFEGRLDLQGERVVNEIPDQGMPMFYAVN